MYGRYDDLPERGALHKLQSHLESCWGLGQYNLASALRLTLNSRRDGSNQMELSDDWVVNWRGLKPLGIPYSRTHWFRLCASGEVPMFFKLGGHRNSPPIPPSLVFELHVSTMNCVIFPI